MLLHYYLFLSELFLVASPVMLSSFSPLMVAPSLPTTSSSSTSPASTYTGLSSTAHTPSHHTTCRIIVGPTDADYITLIIGPSTTVHQLKLDAIKHIAARDHLAAPPLDGSSSDVAEQYMLVRRINPRALMSSYGSSMTFLPHMNAGLLSSASPFNTMVPGFTPPFSPAATTLSMASSAVPVSPTSASAAAVRPPPPVRAAPRKPNTSGNSPTTSGPTSPTSATAATAILPPNSSSSAVSSVATSPRSAVPVLGGQQSQQSVDVPSLSFPLSMFSGGGTLMRLDESDVIYGRHDDSRYDLMLERVTDDVHIRLSIDDEQQQQQQQQQQRGSGTVFQLPLPSDMDRTQSHELASQLGPSGSPSTSASSVFSFPMGQHSVTSASSSTAAASQHTFTTSSADMVERESELSAGLDVCLMSMHGTYLQSAGRGDLRVACLDNCATFTLVDSSACDENGQCYRYLRTERGEYLSADSRGTLSLRDINQPRPAQQSAKGKADEEEKTAATATTSDGSELGLLTRNHRWTIKRGPVQSLLSAHSHYLTIAEEGDITLTPVRYEESCLHICFAILQGALRKKQERGIARLRRWQHKWFVLSGSTLTFYEQQDDIYNRDNNAAIASKLKQQQQSAKASSSHNNDSGNTYSTAGILSINVHPAPSCRFDVEFVNGRVLEVKAESEDERERWVGALRNGKVGKKMDAKAKEGRKKKDRQQTLRQKQTVAAAAAGNPSTVNKQRWEAEEKTPISDDQSLSSASSAVLATTNSNRRQPPPLRIQTHNGGSSTPSYNNAANDEKQPLAITITHHHPTTDTPSAVSSATTHSNNQQQQSPPGHAHKPSFTSSPELSLYNNNKSAVGVSVPVSPFPVSSVGSSSQSSQSASGRSTPFSASQRVAVSSGISKAAGNRRRSLSIG